jgi:hypothetical protein
LALLLVACATPSATRGGSGQAHSSAPARKLDAAAVDPHGSAALAPTLVDADWGTLDSREFGFRMPVPDVHSWTARDAPRRWWSLEHPASRSTLWLRSWRAERRVSREQCREQVYLWQGDLRSSGEPLLDTRLARPRGFDVNLVAHVQPGSPAGLTLLAVAVGANVGRCYAAVLVTHAAGGGADSELGRRLRLFVDGTLNQVELISLEEVPFSPPRL